MSFLRLTGDPKVDVAKLRNWIAVSSAPPVVIETSGSTGHPKRVVLSREAVLSSAMASALRIGTGRWWLTLPSSYVAGMMVIVRSLLTGQDPLLGSRRSGYIEADYVSLVPTQLHRLMATPSTLTNLKAVLVGGGPIDPGLRARAEAEGIRLVATYGSSETSGGCVYDGVSLAGAQVRIGDDERIQVRGPMLFDRYDRDPALTAKVLVDGWFQTADLGRFENGLLTVLGRADDVVISGGVKVPAAAVAARLNEHPSIEQVEVVGAPHEEWGEVVVAFVVGAMSRDEARDWVGEVHPREWAPFEVFELEALPLLANGKVDRQALRDMIE